MKNLILTLFFALFFVPGFSQTNGTQTIYLKNGSIVTGNIIEFVPNKSYTMITSDGNKFVFEVKDIQKIAYQSSSETRKAGPNPTSKSASKNYFSKGYKGVAELGLGTGMGTYGLDIFKLDYINAHRLNENLLVGAGIGVRQPLEDDFPTIIPFYAHIRANLKPKNAITPMANINVGAALNTDEGFDNGGLLINSGIGVYINKSDKALFHASIGYDLMHMPFYILRGEGGPSPYIVKKTRFTEAFVINLGLSF